MRIPQIISLILWVSLTVLLSNCKRERYGCTDLRATNYDASAEIDDGTCNYQPAYYYGDCNSARDGNLVINNLTGETLSV